MIQPEKQKSILIHSAQISLKSIENAVEHVENMHPEKSLILRNSVINPVFGYLAEYEGILSNLRFYSPKIKPTLHNGVRQYSLDSSDNDFCKLLIELYPSHRGTLDISVQENQESFAFIIKQKKEKGLEFLADIFVQILKQDNSFKTDYSLQDHFKKVANLFFSKSFFFTQEIDKMLKLLCIHSFVINLVNSEEEFSKYLTNIVTKVDKTETYIAKHDILQEVIKIHDEITSFPYSARNRPPSNIHIPIYDRSKNNKEYPFLDTATFPDCADVLILNICNCILFNPKTKSYSCENLPKGSDLAEFYSKHTTSFKITFEIRKEWSKVVQGLDNFGNEIENEPFNTNIIVYKREMRNEIKSGLINMMNVLIKIFELDHKAFWSDFKGKQDMQNKLKHLFALINCKFENNSLTVGVSNLSEFGSMGRKDFRGKFDLVFSRSDGEKITVDVEHTDRHAEMSFLKYEKSFDNSIKKCNSAKELYYSLSNSLPENFLKTFLGFDSELFVLDFNYEIVEEILFNDNLETNDCKYTALKSIFQTIEDLMGGIWKDKEENLKNIANNILSSIALTDSGTRKKFGKFLAFQDDLPEQQIVEYWIDSFNKTDSYFYKLWRERLINSNIKNAELDLAKIISDHIKKLFTTLRKYSKLNSIHLKNIPTHIQKKVFNEVVLLKNLKKLTISEIQMNSDTARTLIKKLDKLDNLQYFQLSGKYLDFDVVNEHSELTIAQSLYEVVSNLKELKHLNVLVDNFRTPEIEKLSNELQKSNLQEEVDI